VVLGIVHIGGENLRKKGYTIIELLLVISIVGILATMAIPIYGRTLAYWRHSAALRMILSDIRLIQQQTITERRTGKYMLIFVVDGTVYRLVRGESEELRQLPEGNFIFETNLQNDTLSFNPLGELSNPFKDPNKRETITIRDNSGNESSIVITPATGKVEIIEKAS